MWERIQRVNEWRCVATYIGLYFNLLVLVCKGAHSDVEFRHFRAGHVLSK